jgi:SPX domain protein involved in polyphosphate accumulation
MPRPAVSFHRQVADWDALATEIVQAINSKQLVPTMRTQYMRTAFQIQNDASVRISLDTNLCMIYERDPGVMLGERWYRDPTKAVPEDQASGGVCMRVG